MVAITRPERLNVAVPLAGAAAGGGLVAIAFLVMPTDALERLVVASGIPAVLAAAEPPLGITARLALAIVLGGLVALFAWLGLGRLMPERSLDLSRMFGWLRRDDVHPDAPPRPPLFANRDLGTPFLDVTAARAEALLPIVRASPLESELPADLNQPLAAFDPAAIPIVPRTPAEPLKPLARPQLIDEGDRFETFEMTPIQRPERRPADVPPLTAAWEPAAGHPSAAGPVVAPATESTVNALLARLERGLSAAVAPAPVEPAQPPRAASLQDTLGDLRRLATRAI